MACSMEWSQLREYVGVGCGAYVLGESVQRRMGRAAGRQLDATAAGAYVYFRRLCGHAVLQGARNPLDGRPQLLRMFVNLTIQLLIEACGVEI